MPEDGTCGYAGWSLTSAGKRWMKIRDMDWRQLEAYCLTRLRQTLQDDIWHIQSQEDRPERDGLNQRMDFHIAEHRHDGLGYVIVCKHYPDKVLSQEDIEQVLAYKRRDCLTGGDMRLTLSVPTCNGLQSKCAGTAISAFSGPHYLRLSPVSGPHYLPLRLQSSAPACNPSH